MGIFDWLRPTDINKGVEACRAEPGAVLLDVRTAEEYRDGHIPGSKNAPLDSMEVVLSAVPERDTPLFVYCYSGARSRQAAGALRHMGYSSVKNIGGIAAWRGKVEY